MPAETASSDTLDAEVKGRVSQQGVDAVDKVVKHRRASGARISRADIIREALTEYFGNHPVPREAGNGSEAGS